MLGAGPPRDGIIRTSPGQECSKDKGALPGARRISVYAARFRSATGCKTRVCFKPYHLILHLGEKRVSLCSAKRQSARSSMDRASDYGSEGWGFESLRARSGPPRCDPPVGVLHFYQALLRECFFMPIRTRRHAGTLCVVVAQMVRRRRAFAGGVDADGGLKEKPPPLHETWGVMKLSSPQHAQNLLFLPIFDEQGRFFFHAACESTFSCSAGAVFLSFRSLDASYCEIGSASARTLRTLVKPVAPLRGGMGG